MSEGVRARISLTCVSPPLTHSLVVVNSDSTRVSSLMNDAMYSREVTRSLRHARSRSPTRSHPIFCELTSPGKCHAKHLELSCRLNDYSHVRREAVARY